MPKSSPIQNSFAGGKIADEVKARTDIGRYKESVDDILNYVCLVEGGLIRRSGTKHVVRPYNTTDSNFRLIPFIYSRDQAYVVCLSADLYVIFADNGLVFDPGASGSLTCSITAVTKNFGAGNTLLVVAGNSFVAGDEIYISGVHGVWREDSFDINGGPYEVTARTPSTVTISLDSSDSGISDYVSGGLAELSNYEIPISGATQTDPVVVTTSRDHRLGTGHRVLIQGVNGMPINGWFYVTSLTSTTFSLHEPVSPFDDVDGTGFDAYQDGGTMVKGMYAYAGVPYNSDELSDVKYAQSADVLYLVHPSYPPKKLSRTGFYTWSVADVEFIEGPFENVNVTTTTLTCSGVAAPGATTTVTASAVTGINGGAGFTSKDIGRLLRIKNGTFDVWAWGVITAVASTTSVTLTVAGTYSTGTGAQTDWALGVFCYENGFPSSISFHGGRLWYSGVRAYPLGVYGSMSNDFDTFAPTSIATDLSTYGTSTVTDANGVSFYISSGSQDAIEWLADDPKGLVAGTPGGPFVIRASAQGESITPTNVTARKETSYGATGLQPVNVGTSNLYVSRGSNKVREFGYSYELDGYRSNDLTLLSKATEVGVLDMAYMSEPFSILWCALEGGGLAAMAYDRNSEQLVAAWGPITLGGQSDAAGTQPIVESLCVVPYPEEKRQVLWMVVKRYINGETVRHVEYLEAFFNERTHDFRDQYFVDGGLVYDDPKTITGATQADPVVITSASHGFSDGDEVTIENVVGMTDLNGNTYQVASSATDTFELQDLDGNDIDGTGFSAYVSAGDARKKVSKVSGLRHLEGETLAVMGDGSRQADRTVSDGEITLESPAATVCVGYVSVARGKTLDFDHGGREGTTIGKKKRIVQLSMYLLSINGLTVGPDYDNLKTWNFRPNNTPEGNPTPLFSGIKGPLPFNGVHGRAQVAWEQEDPYPGSILAIMPRIDVQEGG